MSAHTFSFYSADLMPSDTRVWIIDDEHYHLARVLRLGTGDALRVTNGRGLVVTAEIESVGAKRTTANITNVEANLPEPVPLVLALAMLPRDHMDSALTQCIEAGITGFVPVLAERCHVRKLVDRGERWSRIAVAAIKQSGRAWLPHIDAPLESGDVIAKFSSYERVLLADPDGDRADVNAKPVSTLALVGPEAGFSDRERTLFVDA